MATKQQRQLQAALTKFYKNPVAKVSLELFFSAVTIIFFAVFAIRPTLLTMSDLVKEIEDKEKLNRQLQMKIASLAEAQKEYQLYKDDLKLIDQAVPSQTDLMTVLKTIEKLASDNNLVIASLRLDEIPPKLKDPVFTYQNLQRQDRHLQISVLGNYLSVRNLIEDLQANRRTMIVTNVEFRIEEERGKRALKVVLTVNIPYFVPEGAGTAPEETEDETKAAKTKEASD
jgi:Tfp pilus assembly protein PilO